jgi:nucleoside 2-deoxyribosyltransferase
MSGITIVGGVYHESCIWPEWDQIVGSGGRAAAAISGHVDGVRLCSYIKAELISLFQPSATVYGFQFEPTVGTQGISFEYVHSLSTPIVRPSPELIQMNAPIEVSDEVVLRFGMLEGTAVVTAERCVYDPQSPLRPERFAANGSKASHLAIVANRTEVSSMSGRSDPHDGAQVLLDEGAEVVVVKSGPAGAFVILPGEVVHVPAYKSNHVWTIGSGDVFAAVFATAWGVRKESAVAAAKLASLGVAAYADTMALPVPPKEALAKQNFPEASTVSGRVYLAGPFFNLGQRWLIDEARNALRAFGLDFFSPVHHVGRGPAESVAPADLAALHECDRMFAILDGIDSGTLFEVGYARALGVPVYALAQAVAPEELKMVTGSGCIVFDDFVTTIHHTAWRS